MENLHIFTKHASISRWVTIRSFRSDAFCTKSPLIIIINETHSLFYINFPNDED